MWSTFIAQDEEARAANTLAGAHQPSGGLDGLMGRGGRRKRQHRTLSSSGDAISESQEGKIKLTFFVAVTGIMLTVLGVGTEFWVELAPSKTFYNNETCLAAHYGLWKCCIKTFSVSDIDSVRESCGPLDLQTQGGKISYRCLRVLE